MLTEERHHELQGKYITGTLNIEEMRVFLGHLHQDEAAEFREKRIQALERLLSDHERQVANKTEKERIQYEAAVEYKNLTIKWEKAGARWINKYSQTKWFYKNQCFFEWWSGVEAVEHLKKAKEADEKFERFLNS